MSIKVFCKKGGDFFTACQAAVDHANRRNGCRNAKLHVGLAVNVLVENKSSAVSSDVQTRKESLLSVKRCLVFHRDFGHHHVQAFVVPFPEGLAFLLEPFVTGSLKIMLIVGVVDDALDVAFVVARLHFQSVEVVFHGQLS